MRTPRRRRARRNAATRWALSSAVLAASGALSAEPTPSSYQYRDPDGHLVISDQPLDMPGLRLEALWQPWLPPSQRYAHYARNRQRMAPLVTRAAQRASLPAPLIDAVVTAESAYDSDAVSPAGAVGLMQLMPATARHYQVDDARNPVENLLAGARHLKHLLARFDGDLTLALAAYNAGETAVRRFGKIPPYSETQRYVERVLEHYRRYQAEAAAVTR